MRPEERTSAEPGWPRVDTIIAMDAAEGARPRGAVIDEAWRALGPEVAVFSAADGTPLRRTHKRILEPLVLRLRANPELAAPLLRPADAVRVRDLIVGHAGALRVAAEWFVLCRAARRRMRIRDGNAQDLYFPLAFELAVTVGEPGTDADAQAQAAVRGVHTVDRPVAIDQYLSDPVATRALAQALERAWADVVVPEGGTDDGSFTRALEVALSGAAHGAAEHTLAARRQRAWSIAVADDAPYRIGAAAHGRALSGAYSLVDTDLCSTEPQQIPSIVGEGRRPLDRSIAQRVRGTLRRTLDRGELPPVRVLAAEEADRAAAPWGLLGEDTQAAMVAGLRVAEGLRPLAAEPVPGRWGLTAAIDDRLRAEAYVLHARRVLGAGRALHPDQERVVAELRDFRRPYLRRLWARLHGRDVWQERCADADDVRELLSGVARSVSLDHRQLIKRMLEVDVVQ